MHGLLDRAQKKGSDAGRPTRRWRNDDGDVERGEERLALRGNSRHNQRCRYQATKSCEALLRPEAAPVCRASTEARTRGERRDGARHANRDDENGREHARASSCSGIEQQEQEKHPAGGGDRAKVSDSAADAPESPPWRRRGGEDQRKRQQGCSGCGAREAGA